MRVELPRCQRDSVDPLIGDKRRGGRTFLECVWRPFAAWKRIPVIQLMGLVRRVGGTVSLAPTLAQVPVVVHFRDLGPIDSALVCVPLDLVAAVSHDLLQARVPIVECARFEGHKRAEYYERLAEVVRHHRTTALVGAGWNPGMVELFGRAFQLLVPHGHTSL